MEIKAFKSLPKEAKQIRISVFVNEQGFCDEFDETDKNAVHLVAFDNSEPVATARIFYDDRQKMFIIGRIAVIKSRRGENIGSRIIEEAEKEILKLNGNTAYIHAQLQAKGFYQKIGYIPTGKEDVEQGCKHAWMMKKLL